MNAANRQKILPSYYRPNFSGQRPPIYMSRNYPLRTAPVQALHYHEGLELGICRCGSGLDYIEDRCIPYRSGDIQIVLPMQPHYACAAMDTETRWDWIFIHPNCINTHFSPIFSDIHLSGVFAPEQYPDLTRHILELAEELVQALPYAEHCALLQLQLLLFSILRVQPKSRPELERNPAFQLIQPAIECIGRHLSDSGALREPALAALCGISISHLRRCFHSVTGFSPQIYINRARMSCAEHLLCRSDHSILEIAQLSGFENVSCFNRMFRRLRNMTPSQYRAANRLK